MSSQVAPLAQTPFRDCLQLAEDEVAVFACDVCSQPHYDVWSEVNDDLHLKCSRSIPSASKNDIVVLTGALFEPYVEWLRGLGMGPGQVVSYGASNSRVSLAQLVRENPTPLQKAIDKSARRALYIPFYSSARENELCREQGWQLFGCSEDTTLQFFDKLRFKRLCIDLNIPTVEGVNFDRGNPHQPSERDLERLLLALLGAYPSLVVRGTMGSAGKSVYQVDLTSVHEVVALIQRDSGKEFLIEPFLQVIASPNDQWCIRRDGTPAFLGLSVQLFNGFKHMGNLFGQYLSPRITAEIERCSRKIVERMSAAGYRSVLGIDYVVSESGVYPIENNSRLNGSTFAFAIVETVRKNLPDIQCWKFYKALIEPSAFPAFLRRIESVLYDGKRTNSVFPFDCDSLEQRGTFEALLLAEDLYHIDFLERALEGLGAKHI